MVILDAVIAEQVHRIPDELIRRVADHHNLPIYVEIFLLHTCSEPVESTFNLVVIKSNSLFYHFLQKSQILSADVNVKADELLI
jgi:heptaprenylglyceryl phosphate synthase